MKPAIENTALNQEWITLQNNYEQYERSALFIKLASVAIWTIALSAGLNEILIGIVMLILWLQESIFKTYQSRLGNRILRVENLIKQNIQTEDVAFQLHSDWVGQRRGGISLIVEYLKHALKPTVAFPYVVLLLVNCALFIIWSK